MSRKSSRDRRLKFYGLGNTRCPICLVPFREDEVRAGQGVTLEHAPPRTVGGREVCLTCEPCNSRASATSDQAVKRIESPPEVEIETSGIRRRARFWPDGIPPSRMPYRFGSSPAAKEAQRELSKETIVAVTAPMQFDQPTTIEKISMSPIIPNPRHVEVGYLRSAYLLVFSLLGESGYVYARSEAIGMIRAQILKPDDEVGPSLVRSFAPKASSGNMITLRNNARPFFWSVRFDDGTCVILPHGGSKHHYRQIADLPAEQRIQGWEWKPGKFGENYVDRRRLLRQSVSGEHGLFGREYMTVADDGSEQRWIAVNEMGDSMPAGPRVLPKAEQAV